MAASRRERIGASEILAAWRRERIGALVSLAAWRRERRAELLRVRASACDSLCVVSAELVRVCGESRAHGERRACACAW